MTEKTQKKKKIFLNKPFDLNKNGKTDPAEMALIMMVLDDVNKKTQAKNDNENTTDNVINIDDMDIKGI